ncbi:hypothetical protein Tco_1155558 [Tanacetum coccineum]
MITKEEWSRRVFLKYKEHFLVKIRDNTSNGMIGENAFKHIDNFLKVVGPLKIKGLRQDRYYLGDLVKKFAQKFYQLSDNNGEMETNEYDDHNDIADIFKIEGNLFDFETPLCKVFNKFNYLLKIDTNLFTFNIKGIKTYEEYNNNMMEDLEEPWLDNGVPYQRCDHICEPYRFKNGKTKWPTCSSDIDGFCNGGELPGMPKEEALMHNARFEESWEDAAPRVMKFWAWLKSSFENFHELDYDVLVKLEEYNNKKHHDPSICNIRRFKMMKYSFDADDEYVAIKEHAHSDHSRTNIDACQAYRELFRIMDKGWLVTKAKEE